jgi:hypothetical protein
MNEVKKIKTLLHIKEKTYMIKFKRSVVDKRFSSDVLHMEVDAFSKEEAVEKFNNSHVAEILSVDEKA